MFKKIFILSVLTTISGCDINLSSLRPIKWATVDESKIRQTITARFKVENPYPDEINTNYEDGRRESSRISQQISNISSIGSARCRALVSEENGNKVQPSPASVQPYASEIAIMRPSHINPQDIYQQQRSIKYQECMASLENDQLTIDLKAKISKISEIYEARQLHDRTVMEKLQKYVSEKISTYSAENNFDLVVSKSQGQILYNKSKVALDITDAILDEIENTSAK